VKRVIAVFLFIQALLTACGTATPQATQQVLNVYITSGAYPLVGNLYDCAATSSVINLSAPESSEITIRLGAPDHLTTPAYQISTEEIAVIISPQTGVASLTLDQVRSIFLGQVVNWKDVGGKDLPLQVWSYSPEEDIQEIFSQTVMNGQPITSTARLATSSAGMAKAIGTNPGAVGILPRKLMSSELQVVFTAAKVPVLAITKGIPTGSINSLLSCLQRESH
jgi:hypothetical protein